ncbi:DUF202 domain-containing protein [Nocardia stercoris]|uniref:DUF202 domain-containing protein n=1 Tax=Nocardia stercoris TaxID=2483361 RepID=A0A3M2LH31_9NOCA|nr:DUF202 domain-containing protein [Nocardia stercoris]RMI35863.1 DUF202 domain-containing protein [Nocardia stercoris]
MVRPDPATGLAAERTVLAWRRTAVAAMANVVLLLRNAVGADHRAALVVPLVGVVALLTVAVIAVRRSYDLRGPGAHRVTDSRRSVGAVALSVAVVGAAAFLTVASLV